jgi:hypothetical protein
MGISDLFIYQSLSKEQLEFCEEYGYLNMGKALTDEGVVQMRDQAMSAWNKEKEEFREDKSWLQNSLLVNIHHKAPLIRDFYFKGPLLPIANQIIGPNIKGVTSQFTFKMRGNINQQPNASPGAFTFGHYPV